MRTHGIEPIDLVVVNLYPFEETIAKEGVRVEEAVENIDIGGPAMIRSASKNWRDVAVVTDPRLYDGIIEELRSNEGALSLQTRSAARCISLHANRGVRPCDLVLPRQTAFRRRPGFS